MLKMADPDSKGRRVWPRMEFEGKNKQLLRSEVKKKCDDKVKWAQKQDKNEAGYRDVYKKSDWKTFEAKTKQKKSVWEKK